MNKKATPSATNRRLVKPLRVGFVPLTDCAPLIMAHELGLFKKRGLSVRLSREVGWATIRDKIIYGELDAAHALAAMPFAATFGLGSIPCECLTALVLNLNGNAITLSSDLWMRGVRDARSLREEIEHARGKKTYTLGVVFPSSSHNFLLRQWLASGGIDPDQDVRIVTVPAPSMFENLKSGNLDGYCVGEPWNSVAVQAGLGWCVTTSIDLAPWHPEKVLMMRRQFAEDHEAEHLALVAAVTEACAFCDEMENREQVVATIAYPKYVNASVEALRGSMMGAFDFGNGRVETLPDFHVFSRHDANEPSTEKSAWILRNLFSSGAVKNRSAAQAGAEVFRPDLFHQAMQLTSETPRKELESSAELTVAIHT
ncbi:MAG: ABC transporter substrate-binding protein [Verrucomicrobia bacterium]|nr:ABC transporter substrate-binding protein [Verrucomicrobiota bacterium]